MRPAPGEVLHFSEDPTIEVFRPHVAKTAGQVTPYVWAVGHDRAPDYWFPRQCPRAKAGIQLRLLNRLHDFWADTVASTLEWSGIRLRNARP